MPKKPESALHFTIGRSRWLRQAIDYLHILTLLACWLNDLPPVFKMFLSLVMVASWIAQRSACETAPIFLRYTVAEGWGVAFDGEHYLAAKIMPTTVTGRILTILHFRVDDNCHRVLVIVKDAMAANDYRRLVVNLKISGYSPEQ